MIPDRLQLVQQRTDRDCGIACVAMVLGELYEPVYYQLGPGPVFDHERDKFLVQHNVLPRPQLSEGAFMWGSLYLVAVPSKNYPARTHQIVVDLRAEAPNFVVLDPQEGTGAEFWTAEDFTSDRALASWCALIQLIDCDR